MTTMSIENTATATTSIPADQKVDEGKMVSFGFPGDTPVEPTDVEALGPKPEPTKARTTVFLALPSGNEEGISTEKVENQVEVKDDEGNVSLVIKKRVQVSLGGGRYVALNQPQNGAKLSPEKIFGGHLIRVGDYPKFELGPKGDRLVVLVKTGEGISSPSGWHGVETSRGNPFKVSYSIIGEEGKPPLSRNEIYDLQPGDEVLVSWADGTKSLIGNLAGELYRHDGGVEVAWSDLRLADDGIKEEMGKAEKGKRLGALRFRRRKALESLILLVNEKEDWTDLTAHVIHDAPYLQATFVAAFVARCPHREMNEELVRRWNARQTTDIRGNVVDSVDDEGLRRVLGEIRGRKPSSHYADRKAERRQADQAYRAAHKTPKGDAGGGKGKGRR